MGGAALSERQPHMRAETRMRPCSGMPHSGIAAAFCFWYPIPSMVR
jgi:hypothetical protein